MSNGGYQGDPRYRLAWEYHRRQMLRQQQLLRQQMPGNSSGLGAIALFIGLAVAAVLVLNSTGVIHISDASQASTSSQRAGNRGSPGGGTADGARILAEARTHDPEPYVYGGGHPPGSYHRGDGVDCSGLIDVVLLKLYGINENNTAADFRYSKHWKRISKQDAQPGDIMYILMSNHPGRKDDHVVIMLQNNGPNRNPTIFEAYGTLGGSLPESQQIRVSNARSFDEYDGALRFVR